VSIVEPYDHAAAGNAAAVVADFSSFTRPERIVVSWGDGGPVEDLIESGMTDYDPRGDAVTGLGAGTVYGIHEYAAAGRYAVTFTIKERGGSMDSATFFTDVTAPAPAPAAAEPDAGAHSADSAPPPAAVADAEPAATEAFGGRPQVTRVFANGQCLTTNTAFRTAAGADPTFGYPVPDGTNQLRPMPWVNGINSVSIRFDQDATGVVDQGDLALRGSAGAIAVSAFNYEPTTKTAT
jgi:hypothetical protein